MDMAHQRSHHFEPELVQTTRANANIVRDISQWACTRVPIYSAVMQAENVRVSQEGRCATHTYTYIYFFSSLLILKKKLYLVQAK